jgi:DNA-binding response OmpR family regulator
MSRETIRVLLIEDDATFVTLIRKMLSETLTPRFVVEHAERLHDGLERLQRHPCDVVLLDLGLPDSQGLDTCAKVTAQAPKVPIVVLTVLDDEGLAVEAVKQGAQDYLMKGEMSAKLLARVLRYAIERKRLEEVSRQKAALELMNRIMMDREERIIELKQEVDALLKELGRGPKYKL